MSDPGNCRSRVSTFRFTVDVSRALADEIERLANESERSKGDVFRCAIRLLSTAHAMRAQGLHVGAWHEFPDTRPRREFVNFL